MRRGIPASDRDRDVRRAGGVLEGTDPRRDERGGRGRGVRPHRYDAVRELAHAHPDVARHLGDIPSVDDEHGGVSERRRHFAEHLGQQMHHPWRVAPHLAQTIEVEVIAIHSRIDDRARTAERRELVRELPAKSTVATVWERLATEFPAIAPYAASMSCAVNADYARLATEVHDGDEIAFLPPVSGG